VTELVAQDPEGAWGIAEPSGDIRGGLLIDEKSAQRLVLSLEGELRGEEEVLIGRCCYLIASTGWHNIMMLQEH
jgi:hypothetical protein